MSQWRNSFGRSRICSVKTPAATFACRVPQHCGKLPRVMSSELTTRNSRFPNRMRMEPGITRSADQLPPGNFPVLGGALLLTLLLSVSPAWSGENTPPHASTDRSGTIPTSGGLTLHMTAYLGSVNVQRQPPGSPRTVHYSVHIETDAREPLATKLLQNYTLDAASNPSGVTITGEIPQQHTRARGRQQQAQFWVKFLVSVPVDYNVEVSTGAGDIETTDLGGRVVLETDGGNITTGRIGFDRPAAMIGHPMAKIETQGGHISVEDVFGDFDAYTAGGHIRAGNIAGN